MSSSFVTIFYDCEVCGARDSLIHIPAFGLDLPYETCPHCCGPLNFLPNCYTCKHMDDDRILCQEDCTEHDKYERREARR